MSKKSRVKMEARLIFSDFLTTARLSILLLTFCWMYLDWQLLAILSLMLTTALGWMAVHNGRRPLTRWHWIAHRWIHNIVDVLCINVLQTPTLHMTWYLMSGSMLAMEEWRVGRWFRHFQFGPFFLLLAGFLPMYVVVMIMWADWCWMAFQILPRQATPDLVLMLIICVVLSYVEYPWHYAVWVMAIGELGPVKSLGWGLLAMMLSVTVGRWYPSWALVIVIIRAAQIIVQTWNRKILLVSVPGSPASSLCPDPAPSDIDKTSPTDPPLLPIPETPLVAPQ